MDNLAHARRAGSKRRHDGVVRYPPARCWGHSLRFSTGSHRQSFIELESTFSVFVPPAQRLNAAQRRVRHGLASRLVLHEDLDALSQSCNVSDRDNEPLYAISKQ